METQDISEKVTTILTLLDRLTEFKIEKEENILNIKIEGQKDGALIGFKGSNLFAFERILSLVINHDLPYDEKIYVSVDVNGYKMNRENQIRIDVKNIASLVKQSSLPHEMPIMSPRERKIVHDEINEFEGLKSESVGENELRRVIISLK